MLFWVDIFLSATFHFLHSRGRTTAAGKWWVMQCGCHGVLCTLQLVRHRGEREINCCLTSTEARRPIRDGDEGGKGERRVKPQNSRQPGRPRLPYTAARTTKCYGSASPALCSNYRTTQLLSQLLCRTESQRQCPSSAVGKQAKEFQLSSPAPPPCS